MKIYPSRSTDEKSRAKSNATRTGVIFVEYLVLLTIVGIGVIAGLATVRGSLLNELIELADSINAITP